MSMREAGMGESERIAQALVAARREARVLTAYPGAIPATLGQGYAIQDRAIALRGAEVAGWKVGRIPAPLVARFGTDRLAGPIFADRVVGDSPAPAMPVFAGGFAAAEAEFLLRVGAAPDPAKLAYTHAEAAALVDAVHVGIEIASSPYPGINEDGPTVTVSDFGNNHGLVGRRGGAGLAERGFPALAGRPVDRRARYRRGAGAGHARRTVRRGSLPVRAGGGARDRAAAGAVDLLGRGQRGARSAPGRAGGGALRRRA